MTNEERFVVNPLVKWLKEQKAQWEIYTPRHGTSATGWDVEARRKNCDLLIEAKYITGAFLPSFGGLVMSPLAKRPQKFMKRKYRSWSYGICWAIGTTYRPEHLYQILFDYIARNPRFWKSYGKLLKMRYVFFVDKGQVRREKWEELLKLSHQYSKRVDTHTATLRLRRKVSEEIILKQ